MSGHNRTWWKRYLAGMIGGAAGTLAMNYYHQLSARLGAPDPRKPPKVREHDMSLVGRQHSEDESATAALGRILYQKVKGREPDPHTKTAMSYLVHWVYGTDMGGMYGLLHDGVGPLAGGAAFGAAMWVIGDELGVPLMGLSEGPKALPASLHVQMLGAHLAYGLAAAATTALVERLL